VTLFGFEMGLHGEPYTSHLNLLNICPVNLDHNLSFQFRRISECGEIVPSLLRLLSLNSVSGVDSLKTFHSLSLSLSFPQFAVAEIATDVGAQSISTR